jgi:molybdopterin converting factor small subunit
VQVEVRLYATLKEYAPERKQLLMVDLPRGAKIRELLERIGIPEDEEIVILVGGRPANRETVLGDEDRVVMFPPVAGG